MKGLASFNALRDVGDVWNRRGRKSGKLRVENSNNWATGRLRWARWLARHKGSKKWNSEAYEREREIA